MGTSLPAMVGESYRVLRELGRGGMGIVYEAEHVGGGERVAIKVIATDAASDPSSITRFLREARASAAIRSPHVARVNELGTTREGHHYIVMELLRGEDLASVLRSRGALPIGEAVRHVIQACEGMMAAHALGILHRDLKPANLFVAENEEGTRVVKVLDFGLAKIEHVWDAAKTSSHMVFGTPQHMSPEQLKNTSGVDARADVWSLGVILYQLLTGHLPFTGPNVSTVIARVLTEKPPPMIALRPGVPPGLEDVVARCLAKDVDARIPDAASLAGELVPFAMAAPGAPLRSGSADATSAGGVWAPQGSRSDTRASDSSGARRSEWGVALALGVAMLVAGLGVSAVTAPRRAMPAAAVDAIEAPPPALGSGGLDRGPVAPVTAEPLAPLPAGSAAAVAPSRVPGTPKASARPAGIAPRTTAGRSAPVARDPLDGRR